MTDIMMHYSLKLPILNNTRNDNLYCMAFSHCMINDHYDAPELQYTASKMHLPVNQRIV